MTVSKGDGEVCPHCGSNAGCIAKVRVSGHEEHHLTWRGAPVLLEDTAGVQYHDARSVRCRDCGKQVEHPLLTFMRESWR